MERAYRAKRPIYELLVFNSICLFWKSPISKHLELKYDTPNHSDGACHLKKISRFGWSERITFLLLDSQLISSAQFNGLVFNMCINHNQNLHQELVADYYTKSYWIRTWLSLLTYNRYYNADKTYLTTFTKNLSTLNFWKNNFNTITRAQFII